MAPSKSGLACSNTESLKRPYRVGGVAVASLTTVHSPGVEFVSIVCMQPLRCSITYNNFYSQVIKIFVGSHPAPLPASPRETVVTLLLAPAPSIPS